MFLEDMFLEDYENDMFEDNDIDLFAEALSLSGIKSGASGFADKAATKMGIKKQKPLTKKEKIVKAVKEADKKKIAKLLGIIGGALSLGAIIIVGIKKIKSSQAAKDGKVDTKDLDEKAGIVKRLMGKLKGSRTKLTKAEKAANKAAKRNLDKIYGKKQAAALSDGDYAGTQEDLLARGYISPDEIAEINQNVSIIKRIYNFVVKVGKAAGCKIAAAKDAVKNKFTKESVLSENEEYATAFESVLDSTIEEYEAYMESMSLDNYIDDCMIENVIEALESGAYDDDFDF